MFSKGFHFILLVCMSSGSSILPSIIDVNRLESILQDNLKSKDITSLYFAIKGLKQANVKIPDICENIKSTKYDINNVEHIFYLTNAAVLTGCSNFLKPEILSTATQTLNKKDATISELYYAVYSLKALGKGTVYDKEEGLKNLIQLLKKDDSPANYGYVFALCEHMGCGPWTTSHAEGVLQAADESDGRVLYFEGGLPVTTLLLTTIIRTYKAQKKSSPLTEEQRYKFAEYLLSRRSVSTSRGAALLLDAATAIADDEPTPISISIKGQKYITSESDSIEVSISDLIGRAVRSLKPEEVIAQSGTRLSDDVVVLSKHPLSQKLKEPTIYVLNLNKIKAQYGMYKIALSAGAKTINVNVAVLGEIQINHIEIGIGDVDGTTSPKVTTVTYPNVFPETLQADQLQKLTLKFTVRDKFNKAVLLQQAFVRIGSTTSEDEAIFVAEPDNTKAYKVELNVANIAKHLHYTSGLYSVSLYLGDNAVSHPIAWTIGNLQFNFGKDADALSEGVSGVSPGRCALPEISHVFRAAEARPARLVSDVCACLCAAPLVILLVLWAGLGVNFSNFPFTPSALVFHLALGGSLSLYGVLWLQLTMFETMRYLLPLAALTFLSGHRLLRRLVQDKTTRTN